MGMPTVVDDRLVFVVADPDHHLRMVQLTVDDDLVDDHRFRRTTTGWSLVVPRPPVHRIEYRLLVTDDHGDTDVILDPANPHAVATAFGRRSVALLPEYVVPAWLTEPAVVAHRAHHEVATPVGAVPVTTWCPVDLPATTPAPLLVVHDGPEYDDLASLGQWAGAAIAAGRLPRFRMALLRPVARDEWYAANPDWPAAVAAVVATVDADHARRGTVVTMGASLGGLAALQVARRGVVDATGVFSQSGSFFRPQLDPQESDYPWFDRIATWVAAVAPAQDPGPAPAPVPVPVAGRADDHGHRRSGAATATGGPDRLDVVLTCGTHEENHPNNVAMVDDLAAAGHRVTLTSLPDLHNYTAWRDGLEPGLGDLLARQWGDRP